MVLANIYAPNRDNPGFFGELEAKIQQIGEHDAVIGEILIW